MQVTIERVDITGMQEALDYLQSIEDTLKDPSEGLQKALNAVAAQWHSNFNSEGTQYKRWKQLSGRTQAERARLGYGPSGPILRREGTLLSVAIEQFERANGRSGSESGQGIQASYGIEGDTLTLQMSGPKSANQEGGQMLPARPFWYGEGKAALAARQATEAWLKEKFG